MSYFLLLFWPLLRIEGAIEYSKLFTVKELNNVYANLTLLLLTETAQHQPLHVSTITQFNISVSVTREPFQHDKHKCMYMRCIMITNNNQFNLQVPQSVTQNVRFKGHTFALDSCVSINRPKTQNIMNSLCSDFLLMFLMCHSKTRKGALFYSLISFLLIAIV